MIGRSPGEWCESIDIKRKVNKITTNFDTRINKVVKMKFEEVVSTEIKTEIF